MSHTKLDDRAGPPLPAFHFLDADKPVRPMWLWPQRVPLGCLTLLVGDPGTGKSLLACDLAARLTAPRPWPDDPACEKPDPATLPPLPDPLTQEGFDRAFPPIRGFPARRIFPAGAVFAAPEDRDALAGRLAAAGADPQHVCVLDGVRPPFTEDLLPLSLPADAEALRQAIRAHDHPRLVVLDPLHALLETGASSSPDRQTDLLASLADLARRTGVAILAVGHFTKSPARRVLYRIRGSVSLIAAARSVLLLTADPYAPDRRILTQVKSAYGSLAEPLAFRIAAGSDAGPRLEWEDAGSGDWRMATGVLDLSAESFSALSEACDWLTDFLGTGPRPAREVLSAARAAGICAVTLYRAKGLLHVGSRRDGATWCWVVEANWAGT